MGETVGLLLCMTCQDMEWLEAYELAHFIQEHQGHDIRILPDPYGEGYAQFIRALGQLLGWPGEQVKDVGSDS